MRKSRRICYLEQKRGQIRGRSAVSELSFGRSALHDEADPAERGNVMGRVTINRNEVREKPRRDSTQLSVQMEDARTS